MASLNVPETSSSLFFYGTLMSPNVLARVTNRPLSTIHAATSSSSSPNIESTQPNRNTEHQHQSISLYPALLPNHIRHRVRHADYPAVIPDLEGNAVRGILATGLTQGDLIRIDLFEDDEYERREVDVELLSYTDGSLLDSAQAENHNAATVPTPSSAADASHLTNNTTTTKLKAQTYIWTAPQTQLEPREWDYAEFVREKMWRWAPDVDPQVNGEFARVDKVVEDALVEVEREARRKEEGADPTRGRAVGGGFEEMASVREGAAAK